jgi:hypothetical protein
MFGIVSSQKFNVISALKQDNADTDVPQYEPFSKIMLI